MGEIKPDAHNYRLHDERNLKLIKKSLKKYGAGRSILIDADGEIIAGNATFQTAKELGIPVEVVPTDGTKIIALQRTDLRTQDRKRKEMAAVDNSATDLSNWNYPELLNDFTKDELPEIGIDEIPVIEEEHAEITEDEVPEEVETRCKPGDIWQLGDHRLMCGDSTVITDVEKLMNGVKADCFLTDPPYNVAYEGKSKKRLTIQNDKQDDENFRQFLRDAFSCAYTVLKEGAGYYVWHSDREELNFRLALQEVGFLTKQTLIWVKNSFVLGRQDYQWKHEPCLYGWKEGAAHNWYSDRRQTTILEFDRPQKSEEHPTMKPIALFAYQLKNSTPKGGVVLDLFGGSGTSIIACEQTGRKCYTMELDAHYCDVIIKRWENLTGREAVLCK